MSDLENALSIVEHFDVNIKVKGRNGSEKPLLHVRALPSADGTQSQMSTEYHAGAAGLKMAFNMLRAAQAAVLKTLEEDHGFIWKPETAKEAQNESQQPPDIADS